MEKAKSFSGGRRYRNEEITVYWKPSACVHATYCFSELIEVFDPGRRPWIDLSRSPVDKIIETVNMCPTDALTWKWNDNEKNRDISPDQTNHVKFRRPELLEEDLPETPKPKSVVVKVMPDGPVILNGSFTLRYNGKNKEVSDSLISICRCGASDNMPFCDGKHRKTGFRE